MDGGNPKTHKKRVPESLCEYTHVHVHLMETSTGTSTYGCCT